MVVLKFDYINIIIIKLEEIKDFFLNVFGLIVGYCLDFGFLGYWLYSGD